LKNLRGLGVWEPGTGVEMVGNPAAEGAEVAAGAKGTAWAGGAWDSGSSAGPAGFEGLSIGVDARKNPGFLCSSMRSRAQAESLRVWNMALRG